MNFKKTYKSANDKLCADQMIIDEIFEKANKKTFHVYRYVFATVVAAVLVFVSIYAVNINPRTNNSDNSVVYNKSLPKTEKKAAGQSTTNKDIPKASDIGTKDNAVIAGGSDVIYDAADECLPQEECEAASSGGGMNSVMMKSHRENAEYITQKEYFDYLGFSFNQDTALSNGMQMHYPENYYIVKSNDGNIIDDSCVFTISCESRPDVAATLTVGKINAPQLPQDDCCIIEDTRVCITETADNLSAAFFVNNSWCSLAGTGLDREEFTILISGIANKICQ